MIANAYHEAGHAVQALAERLPVQSVSIQPKEGSVGHLLSAKLLCVVNGGESLRMAEGWARVALAGEIAQKMHRRSSVRRRQSSGEYQAATDLALRVSGTTAIAKARFALWLSETETSMRRLWPAVDRVADALLTRDALSGEELRKLTSPLQIV